MLHWSLANTSVRDTAVDVNIYASSPKHAPGLVGNHENTDVGNFIAEYLDLDLGPVTEELKSKGVKQSSTTDYQWMGPEGLAANDNGLLAAFDTYHGDFKHRKREIEECGCGLKH